MLREISLRFGHVPPPLGAVFESSALFRLLEQAPQLRSLDIDEFGALLTLPFSQLLTIRSTFWSLGQLSQCFVMCRSLQKADIFIEDFDVSGFRSRQIYHAGLRALKCTFKRGQNVADVLSTLMLPAINELELSITLLGTIRSSPASALKNMLLESGCRLEKLKLGADFYTSDQELIDILTITPTLTHFELETFDCTVDLFHGLTFRDNVSTILPCLTSLSLRILWLYSTHSRSLSPVPEPEAILSMVQSRRSTDEMAGKAKLTYFGFSARVALAQVANRGWTNLFYSITMPGLRVLEKNGLKLKMQVTVNA
ncbi:hypothetical protein VKT23_013568 [Stygiomarasmius scandens]|uniref:F-box domain-containing protein n=1 Tax=Marasmiellus scandens TaxID=2682957 RepID=A0ABR1J3E1_9AGAR